MNYFVADGEAVELKSKQGKVEGYLVLFSDGNERDTQGDYFTAQTDFGFDGKKEMKTRLLYHHGFGAFGKRTLGEGTLKLTERGVWLDGQLQLSASELAQLESQQLGLSSGTAAHLVERRGGVKSGEITRWPLGLDASLTPTPSDVRTVAYTSIKSMTIPDEAGNDPEAETKAQAVSAGNDTPRETEAQQMKNEDNMSENVVSAAEFAELKSDLVKTMALLEGLKAAPATAGGATSAVKAANSEANSAEMEAKAYLQYLRQGEAGMDAALKPALKAALNEGTAGQGGYLVPTTLSSELVKALNVGSVMRGAGARVMTISGTNSYKVPKLTNSGAAVLTAEAAAYDQAEPTFAQVSFTPYKFTRLNKHSEELAADSQFPIDAILTEDIAFAFTQTENSYFTTGTGTSQPQGLVTGAATGVTAGAAAITADNLVDLYHSMEYQYRSNAVWMMADTTAAYIRKLKDTTNQYLWQPGLANGVSGTLFGRPVITNNSMAAIGTGNRSVVFANLAYYWIIDWQGITVKRLPELYSASGQIGYIASKRFDAKVMLDAAVKALQHA